MKLKLTNWKLILKYVERYGKITPSRMCGRAMWGGFFGSETPRMCRMMRDRNWLTSNREGKFTTFYKGAKFPN